MSREDVEIIIKEYLDYRSNPSLPKPLDFESKHFEEVCNYVLILEGEKKELQEEVELLIKEMTVEGEKSEPVEEELVPQVSPENVEIQPLDIRGKKAENWKEWLLIMQFKFAFLFLPAVYKKLISSTNIVIHRPQKNVDPKNVVKESKTIH